MNCSTWDGFVFALLAGIAVVILALPATGAPSSVAYLCGVAYAIVGYWMWILLIETYPYDEGCEPKAFDLKQSCIAVSLPLGVGLVIVMAVIALVIAVFWTAFQLMTGRLKPADLW